MTHLPNKSKLVKHLKITKHLTIIIIAACFKTKPQPESQYGEAQGSHTSPLHRRRLAGRAQPNFEKKSLRSGFWPRLSKTERWNTSPTPRPVAVLCGSGRCLGLVQRLAPDWCMWLTIPGAPIGAVLVNCQSPGQTGWRRCVVTNGCMCEVRRLNVQMAGAPTSLPIACPEIDSWLCLQKDSRRNIQQCRDLFSPET